MNINKLILAIVAVAAILFATNAAAQTSPDSVNGWNYIGTFNATSDAHYTTLSTDHVQGQSSQLFGFSITSTNYISDSLNGIVWEKHFDTTYTTPLAIEVFTRVTQVSRPLVVFLIVNVVHGDSSTVFSSAPFGTNGNWVNVRIGLTSSISLSLLS